MPTCCWKKRVKLDCAEKPSSADTSRDLGAAGGELGDRRSRRTACRGRSAASGRCRAGTGRRSASATGRPGSRGRSCSRPCSGARAAALSALRMRVSANGEPRQRRAARLAARDVGLHDREHQLLQHELEPLVRQELVVQHLDRQRVGELPDARRDLLAGRRQTGAGRRPRTPPGSCRAASRPRPGTQSSWADRAGLQDRLAAPPGLRNIRFSRVSRQVSPSTRTSRSAPSCLTTTAGRCPPAAPRRRRLRAIAAVRNGRRIRGWGEP